MQQLFYECSSLEFVNVSSFNTSLVGNYNGIFSGCPKLTFLDLSNFERSYCFSCYLGIGNSKDNSGTIIINKNFSSLSIGNGWNVIYKD